MENSKEITKPVIPDWLLKSDAPMSEPNKSGNRFLQKTMQTITQILQDELFCERYAAQKGFLQFIDPRVKLIVILLLMIYTGFTRNIFNLFIFAGLACILARISKISLRLMIKRVWLIIPLIVFVISLPAATNLLIAGKSFISLIPGKLYITDSGAVSVIRTVLRVGVSLSWAFVFVMTTRWSYITRAFSALHLPKLLVTVFNMTYHYIFVLIAILHNMLEARYMRTVGNVKSRENRSYISRSIAFLFLKSSHYSEDIYHAMRLRGYFGKSVSLKQFHFSLYDGLFCANILIVLIFLWFINNAFFI